jgi:drug/metabolite transporter (DMT)-like permease
MGMSGLRHAPLRGALYMLAGVAAFSVMDATVKWLTGGYPMAQLIFIGRLPSPFFAIALALAAGGLRTLETSRLRWHALRCVISTVTMVSFFWALRLLPLADTIAICFVSPLIQSALSVLLLGERVGPRRWFAIVLGFLGVVVIVQPSGTGFGLGPVLALISATAYALSNNISRRMSGTETTQGMMLWFSLLVLAGTGSLLPFQWTPIRGEDVGVFVLYAFSGTIGQFLVIQAFRYGEASLLAPIDYSALIWATLFGLLFWGQFPTPTVLVGAAIIIASSLYVLHRETRQPRPSLDPMTAASRLPKT